MKKIIAVLLALLLVSACATESTVDPNAGEHFYVEGVNGGWSYEQTQWYTSGGGNTYEADAYLITISQSGNYTISKACNCSDDTVHVGYSIAIQGDITVNLTLDNVHMQTSAVIYEGVNEGSSHGWNTLHINGSANVTLTLVGNNSLLSSTKYFSGIGSAYAYGYTSSLTITSDSNGYLTVQGGDNTSAISLNDGSSLNITNANVTVIGGDGSEEAISGVSNISLSYTDGYCTSTSAAGNLLYTTDSGNVNVSGNYFLAYGKDACELLASTE